MSTFLSDTYDNDHLIFCIHCSNNVLNNAFALAGKMLDKNWFPTKLSNNKNISPPKIAIYNFLGRGVKSVGR